ncbi:DUF2786 domain-containing protein [Yinghuangia seranimata]|uniref:DUF2786 domain-containing protein n=1 Tax=Yinghuangia seranimata TaxID=408067 RepID=UPI00248C49EB|nr:DUF2786 domain-containing protein [Yinghuangia seranimata]MDI2130352.1 DUF2786 domain-containing protein [Yinghuangia seranimata]
MPAAQLDEILHAVLGSPDDDAAQVAVDSGASRLADPAERWPEVSRAFLALAERVADGCWSRGWQPADVVRMVGRGLSERHVRLAVDVVAAAARRDPASGRGSRWAAQIRELGADTPWWGGDEHYLPEFARREQLTRFETAGYALEVLRLLGRLPGITPLAAEAAEAAPVADGTEPRVLGRIRGLLAKAESTEFPEEAEALTAKAQELMARYSIDAALVDRSGGGPGVGPGAIRIGVDAPYDGAKALLLNAVAEANRCRTVWSRDFGFSTVIGFDPDLDAVELLYTSLLVQATAAMGRAGSRGRSRSRSFRQSFLVAYAGRIGDRLAAATKQAEATHEAAHPGADGIPAAASDLLPVLAARDVAVQATTDRLFPELTTHRVKIRDEEGWAHGKAAADRATLHPRAVTGR